MDKKFKLTKYACYCTYISQAAVITISPMLFTTFHQLYGISYTKLGLLAVFNFVSQLIIDLIFSFFPQKFNLARTVKITPIITFVGTALYALMPKFFPDNAYFWIVVGTVIFSFAAGLSEVLISPTIAALPMKNPDMEMSLLHSVYAWGVTLVVLVSSLYIKLFGTDSWSYLALFWAIFPIISALLFSLGRMPDLSPGTGSDKSNTNGTPVSAILMFMLCIFLGSATENTMSQWVPGFIENVSGLSRFVVDIACYGLFAVCLGVSRTIYGFKGGNIKRIMTLSFAGSLIAYLAAGISQSSAVSFIACIFAGLCVSMLWPGTLIWIENLYPGCGVVVYAFMAAGGDLGAAIAPQLMGIITDKISVSEFACQLAEKTMLTTDSIGMKAAMLMFVIFPIAGLITVRFIHKKAGVKNNEKTSGN